MLYKAFISYSHAADGQLAPSLQSGLQKMAKPFYRLRAMRIFRDETSLRLTPKLWPTIQQSLSESEHFILMASPAAAGSKWVQDEVNEWLRLQNGSLDKFHIVLTEGEIVWDNSSDDFDPEKTTSLPQNLLGKFRAEPLYLDFRWARESEHLSLRNPQFLRAVGRLAAAIRDEPLDFLIGEDVRQHRVFKFAASAAIILLSSLLLVATGFALYAYTQREEATRQRDNAVKAAQNEREAREEEKRQREQADLARNNEMAARDEADKKRKEAEEALEGEKIATAKAVEAARQEEIARNKAEERRKEAERQKLAAERSYRQSQGSLANSLTMLAREARSQKDNSAAVLYLTAAREAYLTPNVAAEMLATETPFLSPVREFTSLATGSHPLALSPDGTLLAFESANDMVTVYSLRTDHVVLTLGPHQAPVTCLAFSPDGSLLAVGTKDLSSTNKQPVPSQAGGSGATVYLWETATGREVRQFNYLNVFADVTSVSISKGNKFLAAGVMSYVALWDIETGRDVMGRKLDSGTATASVTFSHSGEWVAASSRGHKVKLWDVQSGATLGEGEVTNRSSQVFSRLSPMSLSFSSDDSALATGSGGFSSDLFETPSLKQRTEFPVHQGLVTSVAFLGNSRLIVSGGWDNALRVVDTRSGDQVGKIGSHSGGVWSLSASEDGSTVAARDVTGTIRIWLVKHSGSALPIPDERQQLVSYSYDGRAVFTTPLPTNQFEAPLASGVPETHLVGESTGRRLPLPPEIGGHMRVLGSTPLSQQGRFLLYSGGGRVAGVFDLKERKKIGELELPQSPITNAAISLDAGLIAYTTVATGMADSGLPRGELKVWDFRQRRYVEGLQAPEEFITSLTFSSDGGQLAVGSFVGVVTSWDTRTWRARSIIPPELSLGAPLNLQFTPVGYTLIGAELTGRIWLVDLGSEEPGKIIELKTTELGGIRSLAAHPSGDIIAVAANEGTIYLLDVRRRSILSQFHPQNGQIRSLAFRPDGNVLAAGYDDGSIHFYGGLILNSLEEVERRTRLNLDITSLEVGPGKAMDIKQLGTEATAEINRQPVETAEVEFWDIFTEARNAGERLRRKKEVSKMEVKLAVDKLRSWSRSHAKSGLTMLALDEADRLTAGLTN